MGRYILGRCVHSLLALIGATLVVFILINASGDPASLLIPSDATLQDAAVLRKALGLDRPLITRYAMFLRTAVQGDFGISFRQNRPALQVVAVHLPATAELAAASLVLSVAVAVPLGILAAVYRSSLYDALASILALIGQAAPVFWLGLMGILVFGLKLGLLPVFGRGSLAHLVLPAVTLGWYVSALLMRMTRASMLEVLHQDYIRTARAKGLASGQTILRHALRNAAIPVITVFGLQLGALLSGAVVTETVFAWPGMGRVIVESILARDYPVVMAGVILVALLFIGVNFLVDLAYALLDPRIRFD